MIKKVKGKDVVEKKHGFNLSFMFKNGVIRRSYTNDFKCIEEIGNAIIKIKKERFSKNKILTIKRTDDKHGFMFNVEEIIAFSWEETDD